MTTASGRLHVGFVLYRLTGGGAERTALTLAEALVERGHRVDLLVARLIVAYREGLRPGMRLYHPRFPQAIACGTPVVSTDTPHGPRDILEGGRWGKLTPVGDAPALARAVVEALEGDRPPEAALRRRAAWFSCERAADAHVELFREVLSRHER